jgi:Arc/MetJ-type ribon-helix-helix transcriptional regulator
MALVMGLGLVVKEQVLLTETDSAALVKATKRKRCSKSSLIREALVEWLTASGHLREEEGAASPEKEPAPPPRPTLGELLESERQKRSLRNER